MFRKKNELKANTGIGITPEGKNAAEKDLARGQMFVILSFLDDHSPRTLSTIAEQTGIEMNEVKERIRILISRKLVSYVGDVGDIS